MGQRCDSIRSENARGTADGLLGLALKLDDKVRLKKSAKEAMTQWRTAA
jgi:hypothetical protein